MGKAGNRLIRLLEEVEQVEGIKTGNKNREQIQGTNTGNKYRGFAQSEDLIYKVGIRPKRVSSS